MYVENEADNSRLPRFFNDLASPALAAVLEALFLPGYHDAHHLVGCPQSFSDYALSFALSFGSSMAIVFLQSRRSHRLGLLLPARSLNHREDYLVMHKTREQRGGLLSYSFWPSAWWSPPSISCVQSRAGE